VTIKTLEVRELLKKLTNPVYTGLIIDDIDHVHIFEGVLKTTDPKKTCSVKDVSCCGNIKKADYKQLTSIFECCTVKDALISCINEKKRHVCANCERHLFKEFQEKHRDTK
jgi:hypothetical protein